MIPDMQEKESNTTCHDRQEYLALEQLFSRNLTEPLYCHKQLHFSYLFLSVLIAGVSSYIPVLITSNVS
jgi:hypothetical protein